MKRCQSARTLRHRSKSKKDDSRPHTNRTQRLMQRSQSCVIKSQKKKSRKPINETPRYQKYVPPRITVKNSLYSFPVGSVLPPRPEKRPYSARQIYGMSDHKKRAFASGRDRHSLSHAKLKNILHLKIKSKKQKKKNNSTKQEEECPEEEMDSFYMGIESARHHNHGINSDKADLLFTSSDIENSSVFAFIDNPKEIDQREWFRQCENESAHFNSLLLFADLKYRELARMTNLQTPNTLRTVFCLSLLTKLTSKLPPSYGELLSLCYEEFKNHIFVKKSRFLEDYLEITTFVEQTEELKRDKIHKDNRYQKYSDKTKRVINRIRGSDQTLGLFFRQWKSKVRTLRMHRRFSDKLYSRKQGICEMFLAWQSYTRSEIRDIKIEEKKKLESYIRKLETSNEALQEQNSYLIGQVTDLRYKISRDNLKKNGSRQSVINNTAAAESYSRRRLSKSSGSRNHIYQNNSTSSIIISSGGENQQLLNEEENLTETKEKIMREIKTKQKLIQGQKINVSLKPEQHL